MFWGILYRLRWSNPIDDMGVCELSGLAVQKTLMRD
jgi:hypothetical protein